MKILIPDEIETVNIYNKPMDSSRILKYIEKTGEKIVYSKGLPQYFVSDVFSSDVVTRIGQEDKKLLLYDDFNCIDEGCIIGKVNAETIKQMPKSN